MDVFCRVCGEPFDADEFHDIAAERETHRARPGTVGTVFQGPVTYSEIRDDFAQRGCVAIDGTKCKPTETGAVAAALGDLLGDDGDGIANEMEDYLRLGPEPDPAAAPPVSPYTNEFKDMAGDSAMSVRAQREVLLAAVQRAMFCQITGKVLDRASAVLVIPTQGGTVVMAAGVWDERHLEVAETAAAANVAFEVYDGRELWP